MSEDSEVEEVKPEGCTCGEFMTAPCPVHQQAVPGLEEKQFGHNDVLITDELLLSKEQGIFQGYIFMCPVCKKPAVMVNPDMGKFCCNCGQRVIIHSKIVTDFVKSL